MDSFTWPNCALDRRTVLCLYVPGFQRQIFKHIPKSKWIPLAKLPCIPRANICNVNFVGTFFCVADSATSEHSEFFWIPQTVGEFRNVFTTELTYEQLKARAGIVTYSNVEFKSKDLTIVSGTHHQILNQLLTISVDVIF